MDILDAILASALTPQANLEKDLQELNVALSKVDGAVSAATEAAEQASSAAKSIHLPDITEQHLDFNNYTEDKLSIDNNFISVKNYKESGDNEDGSMTQKAIKEYVKSHSSASQFEPEDAGSVVVVGENGELTPGIVNEEDIIRAEILSGAFTGIEALGLEIDYENKTFTRIQEAAGLTAGEPFNKYSIYHDIRRCIVNDEGDIIAFYGEEDYIDNYTSGYQTMVYIPKFYYMRVPLIVENKIIKKEVIMISRYEQKGFKLHPAFMDDDGDALEFFLFSAYEGSTYNVADGEYNRRDNVINFETDKLASITDAKPISGKNNTLTCEKAEQLARNRGQGWHITSIKAISAIQMLALIEFGTLNIQDAIEEGIGSIDNISNVNCSSYTGSTVDLGNTTGFATSTTNERNGQEYIYQTAGKRAISYRGIENFYGNIWQYLYDIEVHGDGTSQGGIPYVLDIDGEYKPLAFSLPNESNWISNFGYDQLHDWIFLPIATKNANSSLPVGDYLWITTNLNNINIVVFGGNWAFKEYNGMFYYGFDKTKNHSNRTFNARLIFVPQIT